MTAILIAACMGHKEVLQQLINAGANVHATNKVNRSKVILLTFKQRYSF